MTTGMEKAILSWLSGYMSIPAVHPELLGKKNGELLLQIKNGPKTVRNYVFCGSIKKTEFELTLRVSNSDTASRIKALDVLDTVSTICGDSLPALSNGSVAISAGMSEYPKLKKRTDNGDDEYKAVYYIVYREE